MQAANDNSPEMPVDLADYLAQALYHRNARPYDLIGGSNAKILEDALDEINRLRRGLAPQNKSHYGVIATL